MIKQALQTQLHPLAWTHLLAPLADARQFPARALEQALRRWCLRVWEVLVHVNPGVNLLITCIHSGLPVLYLALSSLLPPFQCIPSLLLLRLLDFLFRHQGLQCQSNFWGQVRLGCRIVHHSGQKMELQLLLPCNTKMRVSAFTVPRCNRFIQVSCLTTPLICISADLKPSVFPVSISDFSFCLSSYKPNVCTLHGVMEVVVPTSSFNCEPCVLWNSSPCSSS